MKINPGQVNVTLMAQEEELTNILYNSSSGDIYVCAIDCIKEVDRSSESEGRSQCRITFNLHSL